MTLQRVVERHRDALEVDVTKASEDFRLGRNALILLLILGMAALPALGAEGKIRIVSRVPPQIAPDTAGGYDAWASADGRYVAFTSGAPNLVPGQVDHAYSNDVF